MVDVDNITDQLPTDIDALQALVAAARAERDAAIAKCDAVIAERDHALTQMDRLRHLLRQLQRAKFGRRSEKLDPEQLLLAIEDIEQAIAGDEAAEDKKDPAGARKRADKRRADRGALPAHLPHTDVTIAPEDTNCPCCHTPMHVIGEEIVSFVLVGSRLGGAAEGRSDFGSVAFSMPLGLILGRR